MRDNALEKAALVSKTTRGTGMRVRACVRAYVRVLVSVRLRQRVRVCGGKTMDPRANHGHSSPPALTASVCPLFVDCR